MWNYSTELRGSFGYKDNVTLSHTNRQSSPFWNSGLELMIFRLPSHGWQFHFFGDFSDVRYFDSPEVDNEQLGVAAAQLTKSFGGGWKSLLGVNYLYQNQVYDYSDVYTQEASVGQILGHTLSARWATRRTWGANWLEAELSGARNLLEEPLDDYWQYGPRLVAGHTWSKDSELTLAYQYARIDYDSREQVDSLGTVISNSVLALDSHSVDLTLTYFWDKDRHWQTVSSLGYEISLDNHSGFYDYDLYRFSQSVRYRAEPWEVTVRARINYLDYPVQTVSATDPTLREKTLVTVSLLVERRLSKNVKAHASYVWDRSISNLEFDDYSASTVTAGLSLAF